MPHRIRRIGLLPGSFNPPHLGHVDLALQSCDSAGLDGCFYYINSINAAKQADLIPWQQRRQLLELVLGGQSRFILGPDYFADDCRGARVPQETIFLALVKKLTSTFGRCHEVWLVRGSDNFRPPRGDQFPYPPGLCDIPHVIGLRSNDHRYYDYTILKRKLFVDTRSISSSEVREILLQGGSVTHLINRAAEEYIIANELFGVGRR